jgi:hypothetical protein
MSTPIYHRGSARLRDLVDAQGARSATVPALLLLGLAAAGVNVIALRREALAALDGELAPALRARLEALFFGPSPASTPLAVRLQPASTPPEAPLMTLEQLDSLPAGDDDPLGSIGFEV